MLLLLVASLAFRLSAQEATPNRFALVIGVQNYSSVPALQHSLNDAYDMVSVLKSSGFKVDFLSYAKGEITRLKLDKGCGFSIRCIKAPLSENKVAPRLRRGK